MPKCSRCGSYFIRLPCPVCSPPGVEQLVEDSPEVKGKSVDELQNDLKQMQDILKEKELEFETRSEELKARMETITNQISDLEFSKVSSEEKKRTSDKEISGLANELNSQEVALEKLEGEKQSLLDSVQQAEEKIQSLDSEISGLKERIEQNRHEEEGHRQREEEERRQREEEERRQRDEQAESDPKTETNEGDY